ncbi:MAG TPA: PIG-L deacetylase family protein [Desertimonas sp.]|nr:PIG-L deacetylase family protein [Desertimonas sp.]
MVANDPGQPTLSSDAAALAREATIDLDVPPCALAIGAHPDDIEFGAGATLAKWADAGCLVHHLVCTDGSKGTWDPEANIATLVTRRREEQREAARRLSGARAGEVIFLDRVDGELENDAGTRTEVVRAIRRLRPDVVLGHDPWKRYRLHPDHRVAGQLVCDAIVGARDPHFHRDLGLDPFRPQALLLFEADLPNHAEDVTATVERKLAALLAHESQFESTMHAKGGDPELLEAFRARILDRLAELGAPWDLRYAEVFALMIDL